MCFRVKKKTRLEILYSDDPSKAFDDVYREIVGKLCIQYNVPVGRLNDFFAHCLKQDSVRSRHIVESRFKKRVYRSWERKGRVECFKCGSKVGLTMHHVRTRNLFPEFEFDVGNIVLLCEDCHRREHNLVPVSERKSLKDIE